MNYLKVITAFIVTVMFFSLFSGCKIKQKHQEKSTETSSLETKISTLASTQKNDSTASVKTDQSVSKSSETKKSTSTRSIKLTIELDSNQNVVADSMGNFSLNSLVNSALRNARKIQIEAQEQQSTEGHQDKSTALDKREEFVNFNRQTTDASETSEEINQKHSDKSQTATIKDGTVKSNVSGTLMWIVVLGFLVFVVFHFYTYTRKRK